MCEFAMNVSDTAMEPRLNRNDVVVVNPALAPRSGWFVAARGWASEYAVVRQYRASDQIRNRCEFELVPLNPSYPVIRSPEVRLLGVVVGRCQRLH